MTPRWEFSETIDMIAIEIATAIVTGTETLTGIAMIVAESAAAATGIVTIITAAPFNCARQRYMRDTTKASSRAVTTVRRIVVLTFVARALTKRPRRITAHVLG